MPDDAVVGPPRASDSDREHAALVLRDAHAIGMLTVGELTQRLEAVYGASTVQELAKVTGDLPVREVARGQTVVPRARRRRLALGLIGGPTIRGRFRAARHMVMLSILGGGDVDLSRAEIDQRGVTIVAVSLIGGGDIHVPAGFQLEMGGLSLIGGGDEHEGEASGGPPAGVVRVRYLSLIGGPDVHHGTTGNSRGHASAAIAQIAQLAFSELRLHRIEAGRLPHNIVAAVAGADLVEHEELDWGAY